MKIDLVTVEKPILINYPGGSVNIEAGKVLMGEIVGDKFVYPLTIGDKRVEFHEFFENKRILPIFDNLTLS